VQSLKLKLLGVKLWSFYSIDNKLKNRPVFYTDYFYIPNVIFDQMDNVLVPYVEN